MAMRYSFANVVAMYLALIVFAAAARFALNKWQVSGLTELVNAGV